MKILHISDIHGHVGIINKIVMKAKKNAVELIIISGDITHFGSLAEFRSILEEIQSKSKLKVLFVPGNCDPKEALSIDWPPDIRNLHNGIVKISKYYFAGLGGAPKSPLYSLISWTEDEIERVIFRFSEIPPDFLILVSHAPPYGTKVDLTKRGIHAGSISLRKFIELRQPRLVLVGHIHEGRGFDKIGKTIIVNPGSAKNGYASVVSLDPLSVELIEL